MSSNQAHRAGGKITASHSTLNSTATYIVDYLQKIDCVSKIAIGVIKPVSGRGSGQSSVKIVDELSAVLVQVTGKGSSQTLRFYTSDRESAKAQLADYVRKQKWILRVGSKI